MGSHAFTWTDSKDNMVIVWKFVGLYHVIEHRNDRLKSMQVLTESSMELVDEGCRITSLNLTNTTKQNQRKRCRITSLNLTNTTRPSMTEKLIPRIQESARITWPLTLTLSTPWMQAYLETIVCKFGGDPAICLGEEAIFFRDSTKVPVSRDLWPWPLTLSTPWVQAYLETIMCKFGRDRAICLGEEAIFVPAQVPVSCDLWPWAHPGCTLTWSPSCESLVAIRPFVLEKKRFAQKFTDRQTDRQTTDASPLHKLILGMR